MLEQRPGQSDLVFFTYQRDKYILDPNTNVFTRIIYPCDSSPPLSTFQSTKGLSTAEQVEQTRLDFGKNLFDIPIPTFGELFAEHATAPFFVFQVFCAGLWCMDEYWYYSLFTLFMLIVFECTTVFQVRLSLSPFSSELG
jgi:cation-transporting ATPase 13A1